MVGIILRLTFDGDTQGVCNVRLYAGYNFDIYIWWWLTRGVQNKLRLTLDGDTLYPVVTVLKQKQQMEIITTVCTYIFGETCLIKQYQDI